MATKTEEITLPAVSQGQLLLEDFVKNATWREVLVDLVETNKLDPWDIDIAKVVSGYIEVVTKMKVVDLHVPANIMLAAAILLRFKSDSLRIIEIQEEVPEELVANQRILPEIPTLVPRFRIQPNRKITLNELMEALDEAMKLKEKRETMLQTSLEPMKFVINQDDIDEKIEATYGLIKASADKTGLTTFAELANRLSNTESILLGLFIPLLFLAHRERVTLAQDKFFDEIYVKLNRGK